MTEILNSMSGMVKSTDPEEIKVQEALVLEGKASFRTTVMFTATMPASVERLAKLYMKSPVTVSIHTPTEDRRCRGQGK